MEKKTILLFSVLFLSNFTIINQNLPFIISNDEKIFSNIIKTIEKNFPSGTEILLYDYFFINIEEKEEILLKEKFNNYFKKQTKVTKIKTLEEIIDINDEIKETIINYPSEEEIIYIAKYFNFDCLILINISKLNQKRKIFDSKLKKIVEKTIYLLQGNLINPDDSKVFFRLYEYFYLE